MARAYINGIGVLTSQETANGVPEQVTGVVADYLKCLEPDYKQFINPIAARRMSRLIKMGITTARLAMADAGLEMPDAIITGTGLGSVEDTEKLLGEIRTGTSIVNPTPFIQSTYNTISSQIAINMKCHNYNSTYVHRSVSFESAMMDGLLQLEEGMAGQVLAGGIDEMTPTHLGIIRRLGHWKMEPASNLDLLSYATPGALAGEGAGFFVIGREAGANAYCAVEFLETWFPATDGSSGTIEVTEVLSRRGYRVEDIDLLILGYNGDKEYDTIYDRVSDPHFPGKPAAWYKHISGEYYTATAVGIWMAANILKRQHVPESVLLKGPLLSRIRNILLYNQYRGGYHTLYLLSAL